MKSSKKRGWILIIFGLLIAGGLYYTSSVGVRVAKLHSIAGREIGFQFMSFELRNFGKVTVVDEIELPPQPQVGKSFVPVYSLELFETFRGYCGEPMVYTMMEPSRTDEPNHFSDNKRTLRTTYFRTYYFFNNAGTTVWQYNHTIEFKVQLRGED